jgi:hypothetical protein
MTTNTLTPETNTNNYAAETSPLPESSASTDHGEFAFHTRHSHNTDNCLLEFNEHRRPDGAQVLLAHLQLYKSDEAALNDALQFWQAIRPHVKCPIFTTMPIENEHGTQVMALFGFKPLQRVLCNDNTERQLYFHTV